jgi:sulfatase maturation enzyme AslB (radical SAM superfamily)
VLYAEHILQRYQELHTHLEQETLPSRDFELFYDQTRIATLANRKELSKVDMELFSKGKKVRKGDWNCSYCPFKNICYESNGTARELTKLDVSDIERISTVVGDSDENQESE